MQKGLRMIGQGMHGFVGNNTKEIPTDELDKALKAPTDTRVFAISQALHAGYTIEQIHALTKIDCWFLDKLQSIVRTSQRLGEVAAIDPLRTPASRQASGLLRLPDRTLRPRR